MKKDEESILVLFLLYFLAQPRQNRLIGFYKLLQIHCTVGRAGGRQPHCLDPGYRLLEPSIELPGCCTSGENCPDGCPIKDFRKIVRDRIADARIGGSIDLTRRQNVPQSNSVPQQQAFFLRDSLGNILAQNS